MKQISDEHYCGAPWQETPPDLPPNWVPGVCSLTATHYPASPFLRREAAAPAPVAPHDTAERVGRLLAGMCDGPTADAAPFIAWVRAITPRTNG